MNNNYSVGNIQPEWNDGMAQTLTFIVTEDCNLRCKYCYVTHKSKNKVMKLETAIKFIDYILEDTKFIKSEAVILDFIGGEPLLEASLIDQICDYFKTKTYKLRNQWYWNYKISISTNGVNYSDPCVQNLILKNEGKISIGITIDGIKEKHDLQRVFPDGSGSYDIVYNNVKLWLEQFEGSTKVTFSSDDLIYLKDSIIHLWNIGIKTIAANVVYENVWKDKDEIIFENQLKELADYIVDNDLYDKYECSLFLGDIGMPYSEDDLDRTSCGAGKILALGPNGKIYPCVRYYDHSLNHRVGYVIGDIEKGIDYELARTFLLTSYKYQCDDECLNCSVAKGCEFCQGFNYDEADSNTNFQKAKYICKMHKARVRANNYYFAKLFHKKGIKRQNYYWKNNLVFLLNDNYVSDCSYQNNSLQNIGMNEKRIREGLKFAEENFMKPIFLHSRNIEKDSLVEYEEYEILHRIPIEGYREGLPFDEYQLIITVDSISHIKRIKEQEIVIFNIEEKNISKLSYFIEKILSKTQRININIMNISRNFNMKDYYRELKKCADLLIEEFKRTQIFKEINIITDIFFIYKHEECNAGSRSFTYAPDGNLYVCPAFYSEKMGNIGNIYTGITLPNRNLYTTKYMPICNVCDCFQCENCKYLNKKYTNEVNISPSFQCDKAQIERKISVYFQQNLKNMWEFEKELDDIKCEDPIKILERKGMYMGYYNSEDIESKLEEIN